jgi:hypothetical protein
MKELTKKSFWISLCSFGLINYVILWVYIPKSILSGNPAIDGIVVHGFPFTTRTSGGCNFRGSCMDFNLFNFWLNIIVLITLTFLIAIVFQRGKTFWGGVKSTVHFLFGWLIIFGLLFATSFIVNIESVLNIKPVLQAIIVSLLYNSYYFLAPNHLPFTLTERN